MPDQEAPAHPLDELLPPELQDPPEVVDEQRVATLGQREGSERRAFVEALEDNQEDQMIVKTIIAMGQNLDIRIVGEGVETDFQQAFLLEHGCDYIQGNLRHRAIPGAELERRILTTQ